MSETNEVFGNNVVTLIPNTRIIYINGIIDAQAAYLFNIMLLDLEHKDPNQDITVYINSNGGEINSGLAMIDTMNLISCDVATVCIGMAASMGALLLMSGQKGKRYILPHSMVLIHQPLQNFGNSLMQATDIEIAARQISRVKNMVYRIISDATGQTYEKVEEDCDRDYTLFAQEALDYGIVDSIVKSHIK